MHGSMKNEALIQLMGLQKSLVYISTSLRSNEATLKRIARGNLVTLYEEDEDLMQDVLIEIRQAMEMAEIYTNILASTMDAYASIISNNLNIVMKVLTSVTVLIPASASARATAAPPSSRQACRSPPSKRLSRPIRNERERPPTVCRRAHFAYQTLSCACDFSGSRLVMLLRLMARVDVLCSSAEVVGGRIPATPSTMSEKLKPTMKR